MGLARLLRLCPLALLLLLAPLSCQRRPAALTAVSGKVQFQGHLLPAGLIVFTPDASRGESGPVAYGKIRGDGSYTLLTGETEGAAAGWYRVTVAAFTPYAGHDHLPPPVSLLPEKYRDPGLSLLRCEVKPDRVNQLDFNLD
jgi:hypothetical protein